MIALARLPDASQAKVARHAVGLGLVEAPHPDAELLALCTDLGRLQDGWQQRWAACPEEGNGRSKADRELDRYTAQVWPGTRRGRRAGPDLVAKLLTLRATTVEGAQAKAAAICAIDDTCGYTPLEICGREDDLELAKSALQDAAGPARRLVGEHAK